jgi:hypothetical protein
LVIGYFAWQTYHYQKQNYGIFSFIAAGTDRIRPTLLERAILQLSVFLGILGLLKTYNLAKNTALLRFSDSIYETAAYAFWIIPVLLLAAAAFSPALRRNPLRMIFLALGGFFYLPIFLFTNPVAAVSGYAAGHGLQYLVFMYFVGASKPDRDLRIIILAAVALVAGTVLALMSDTTLWGQPAKIVFGCYLGLVMSHFVIDAGIWKLREAFPRRYMSNAFNFVFLRGSKAAPGEAPAMPVTGSPTGGRMQALAT